MCEFSFFHLLQKFNFIYLFSPQTKVAVHEPTGQKVALKVVNRAKQGDRLQREIEILRLFRHPHIIRLYEVIYTSEEVYMVVEYVPGGELFEYLISKGRVIFCLFIYLFI